MSVTVGAPAPVSAPGASSDGDESDVLGAVDTLSFATSPRSTVVCVCWFIARGRRGGHPPGRDSLERRPGQHNRSHTTVSPIHRTGVCFSGTAGSLPGTNYSTRLHMLKRQYFNCARLFPRTGSTVCGGRCRPNRPTEATLRRPVDPGTGHRGAGDGRRSFCGPDSRRQSSTSVERAEYSRLRSQGRRGVAGLTAQKNRVGGATGNRTEWWGVVRFPDIATGGSDIVIRSFPRADAIRRDDLRESLEPVIPAAAGPS